MSRLKFLIPTKWGCAVLALGFWNSAWATPEAMVQFLASQQLVQAGKEVFRQNCAGCHGVDADGKGPAALMLSPKPRNLVTGAFKFRSTSLGSLPTDQDLLRTIDQGIAGSSMPAFPLLSSHQKYALVAYIKSLRPNWQANVGKALTIPEPPTEIFINRTLFLASAVRGRKLFEDGCLTCHGDRGHGDGPSAEGLVDGDNQPIHPANLGRRGVKSGKRAQDIYKAILTGLDGTPMPSFEGIYTEVQIWELVSYVFFLRGQGAGIYDENLELNDAMLKAEVEFKTPVKSKPTNSKSAPAESDNWE